MEEDIIYLENKIENNLILSRHNVRDYQAIKNIIARNKELEQKYNEESEENLKMSEWLVEKQKRIEEQEKMIDLMAKYITGFDVDEDVCRKMGKPDKYGNCEENCAECIKEHFKKKVRDEE